MSDQPATEPIKGTVWIRDDTRDAWRAGELTEDQLRDVVREMFAQALLDGHDAVLVGPVAIEVVPEEPHPTYDRVIVNITGQVQR